MLDIVIIASLVLFGWVSYRIIQRHLADDLFRLKGDIEAMQLKANLFFSKVAILEQYIDDYWTNIPEDEAEDINVLHHIREGLGKVLLECRIRLKHRDFDDVHEMLKKLSGETANVKSNLAMFQLLRWEERGHKIILKLCQKLTLEASVAQKSAGFKNYRRTPTLLSLREISELLREERSTRY